MISLRARQQRFLLIRKHGRIKNAQADIIHEKELRNLLGDSFINILSDEMINGYHHGFITADFLRSKIGTVNRKFYICGPPPMMHALDKILIDLGVSKDKVVVEI